MLIKLSAKGQATIPRSIRKAMGLEAGMLLTVRQDGRTIVLEPLAAVSPVEWLYGRYASADLLEQFEEERRQELARDETLGA